MKNDDTENLAPKNDGETLQFNTNNTQAGSGYHF